MTPGLRLCTFDETHPKLARKEPLIVRQAHVHAALDSLDVLSVRCVCAYKTKQLTFVIFLAFETRVKNKKNPYLLGSY